MSMLNRVAAKSGVDIKQVEAVLESVSDEIGWPELKAFNYEIRKGQSIREDAGGYLVRCVRRLFGLPEVEEEVVTYQRAAEALIQEIRQDL